ncbi:Separase [Vitis vinifera]|uniref:separase n=1 Tax=Vitis vinifera TaxID=29760 RepID=A0A438IGY4_VITVI|nr:Separase [Vitis vinifera]
MAELQKEEVSETEKPRPEILVPHLGWKDDTLLAIEDGEKEFSCPRTTPSAAKRLHHHHLTANSVQLGIKLGCGIHFIVDSVQLGTKFSCNVYSSIPCVASSMGFITLPSTLSRTKLSWRIVDSCLNGANGVNHGFRFVVGMGEMEFIRCNHSMYSNATTSFSILEASGSMRFYHRNETMRVWRTFNHDQRSQSGICSVKRWKDSFFIHMAKSSPKAEGSFKCNVALCSHLHSSWVLNLESHVVFTAITSICTIGWVGGYAVPIFARMVMAEKNFKLGPFYLGKRENQFAWKWFKDQNIEGKGRIAPTVEELAGALKSHDLFIYIGHGSGAQCIPRHEIQKLENRAATLLMGCSSGSLSLNGQYTLQGTHLSYLSAGSPVIVVNLWEVTDKDIDRFGKAMLVAWLRERSSPSVVCAQCHLVAELKSMSIIGVKGDAKKKIPMKNKVSATSLGIVNVDFRPRQQAVCQAKMTQESICHLLHTTCCMVCMATFGPCGILDFLLI